MTAQAASQTGTPDSCGRRLRADTRVPVLFEDRALTAVDVSFVDDFLGCDLDQRFGGGPLPGYGDAPVALHVYEIG